MSIGYVLLCNNGYAAGSERDRFETPPSPLRTPTSHSEREARETPPGAACGIAERAAWEGESVGTMGTLVSRGRVRQGQIELRNWRSWCIAVAFGLGMEEELETHGFGSFVTEDDGARIFEIADHRKVRRAEIPAALKAAIMDRAETIVEELEDTKDDYAETVTKLEKQADNSDERAARASASLEAAELEMIKMRRRIKEYDGQITALAVERAREEVEKRDSRIGVISRELAGVRATLARAGVRSPGLRSPAGRARAAGTPRSARKGAAARAESPTKDRLRSSLEQERVRNEELSARLAELEARMAGSSVFSPSRHGGASRETMRDLRRSSSPITTPGSRSGGASASPSHRAVEETALAAAEADRRLSDGLSRALLPAGRENRVEASSSRGSNLRKPRRGASGITSRRTPGKASSARTAQAMAAALEEEKTDGLS